MRWNFLAVVGILIGLGMIRWGLDTMVEWRAWFLSLTGLVFLLVGSLRIYVRVRRYRKEL